MEGRKGNMAKAARFHLVNYRGQILALKAD